MAQNQPEEGGMKIIYSPATDVMRIIFRDVPVDDYNEEQPGIKMDYDLDDQLVAIEIHKASTLMDDPRVLDHQILPSDFGS
ncbi:DUF2283 domain-containing protein [Rivularia sp. UHCC 0363]|uniref:DUF2283 domain-containing protein n=1 Tax=Rivularia sp. UHCC 0363 TaxID=3110244 RepID=UPI002B20DA70|nr:DUF2283 domain-containing protein [Rivularia sp. UHCC 0363]MEA5597430.1 DUF2283 domain-containing protein [Rivularia sp. UHCC 0363]